MKKTPSPIAEFGPETPGYAHLNEAQRALSQKNKGVEVNRDSKLKKSREQALPKKTSSPA